MKKFIAAAIGLILLIMSFNGVARGALYTKGENIAVKAAVTASQKGGDATSDPRFVNDGKKPSVASGATKWFVLNKAFDAWIELKFENTVMIKGAKVFCGTTNSAEKDILEDFDLEYYDGSKWQIIAEVRGNTRFDVETEFVKAVSSDRFRVKSKMTKRFRLREIELYEAAVAEGISEGGNVIMPQEVKDTKYSVAVGTLLNTSLLQDGTYDFSQKDMIKRIEFVKMLLDFMEVDWERYSEETTFIDVYGDERRVLAAAEALGLICGDEVYFYPYNEMKYDAAAEMVVQALGYAPKVSIDGSAFRKAQELKLLDGINKRRDRYITPCDGAMILYNALDAKVMEAVSYGKTVKYETSRTYAETIDIKTTENILLSSDYIQMGEAVSEGQVDIGGEVFSVGETNAPELVGRYVKARYAEKSGDNILLYVYPVENKNRVYEIDPEDVDKGKTDLTQISCRTDGKDKLLKLSQNVDIFKNGSKKGINASTLIPENGHITAIDNNGDNRIDCLIIKEFITFEARAVNTRSEIIYDKNYSCDINYQNYRYVVIKDGEYNTADSIREGDIVSAELSEENKYMRLYVSSVKIEGKVTEYEKGEYLKIQGDETRYAVSDAAEGIKVGGSIAAKTDFFGKIVSVETLEGEYTYGLLIGCEKDGIEKIAAKIIDENSVTRIYSIINSTTVNNEKTDTASLLGCSNTIIKFKADKNGVIKNIYMAKEEPASEPEYLTNGTNELIRYKNADNYYCSGGILSENGNRRNIVISNDTVIFKRLKNETGDYERDYTVSKGAKILGTKTLVGTVELYNINEDSTPGAVYFEALPSAEPITASGPCAVVHSVKYSTQRSEYGEEKMLLCMYMDGREYELVIDEESIYNKVQNTFKNGFGNYDKIPYGDIKPGDVLQIVTDGKKITTYRILMTADDRDKEGFIQQCAGDRPNVCPLLETAVGYVTHISDSAVSINIEGEKITFANSSVNIYVYDTRTNKVKIGSSSDIHAQPGGGSKVFVRATSKLLKDIVVFE